MSEPIPSSTVVLLRDTAEGLAVLLLRRNSEIAYGGSWVFPGGRIDAADREAAGDEVLGAAQRAAVRETREEAGLEIDAGELVYLSHWTTPVIRPKRFSTWFFLAPARAVEVTIDGGEIHDWEWRTPRAALEARRTGEIELPPPTFVTLTQLLPFGDVASALAHFGSRQPVKIQPKVTKTSDAVVYLYDEDAGYETLDPAVSGARHRLVQAHGGDWDYQYHPIP